MSSSPTVEKDASSPVEEEEKNGTDTISAMKEKVAKETMSNGNAKNGDSNGNGKDEKSSEDEEENDKKSDEEENDKQSDEEENDEKSDEKQEETNDDNKSDDEDAKVTNGSKEPEVRRSRRKTPIKVRPESEDDDEEDLNDVEEIKDDDDVMEVDESDPLATTKSKKGSLTATSTSGGKTNVVTIDDVKMLQKLAASNAYKKKSEKNDSDNKLVLIDTDSILAGKSTSGVTITPARPKNNLPSLAHGLPSGVTISQATPNKGGLNSYSNKLGYSTTNLDGRSPKAELNDPNLTDDTFVVEAPSFIVPYVYEKPPKETFTEFKEDVKKLQTERSKKKKEDKLKRKEEKADKKSKKAKKSSDDPDYDSKGDSDSEKSKVSSESESDDEDDVLELDAPKEKKVSDSFFDTALGKFFIDMGLNLVQETVQTDLLKQQIRKSQKDKSASVMHAIMSLKKNLETSKETNKEYRFELKKCKFCSFKTESELALANHYETPHVKHAFYRCNFCPFETKIPQEVLTHMMANHGMRGKLERAPSMQQCPQCPFEDNMKGKLTRHKTGCDKRFRPERNQEPAFDWEPPAKIPKPPTVRAGRSMGITGYQGMLPSVPNSNPAARQGMMKGMYSNMPRIHLGGSAASAAAAVAAARGRGRGVGPGGSYSSLNANRQMVGGHILNNQVVLQALNQGARGSTSITSANNSSSVLLPNSSSVTIQGVNQRSTRGSNSPSISITPLSGRGQTGGGNNRSSSSLMKPGQPNPGQGKGNLVICEICDGFIKDLEQLRNHMQWIHKVKIHPKMIYSRPPLNCQKCKYRFFTDQGLERHLLGSHGLVTASMQELADKGEDSGRCPVCGKVYQWKLLSHVSTDHDKTLKPAHLSYKCTVCTSTFGQYKQFEEHVYTAHSGAAKRAEKSKLQKQQQQQSSSSSSVLRTPTLSDEITIIPQKKTSAQTTSAKTPSNDAKDKPKVKKNLSKENDPDVIELDDEEETDDTEGGSKSEAGASKKASKKKDSETSESTRKRAAEKTTGSSEKKQKVQEGVEEIVEEEDEDDN